MYINPMLNIQEIIAVLNTIITKVCSVVNSIKNAVISARKSALNFHVCAGQPTKLILINKQLVLMI